MKFSTLVIFLAGSGLVRSGFGALAAKDRHKFGRLANFPTQEPQTPASRDSEPSFLSTARLGSKSPSPAGGNPVTPPQNILSAKTVSSGPVPRSSDSLSPRGKDIKVGEWTSSTFRGHWTSDQPSQSSFIPTQRGLVLVSFAYIPEVKRDSITAYVRILESDYIEDKVIAFMQVIPLSSSEQTSLEISAPFAAKLIERVFITNRSINCDASIKFSLLDKAGGPLPISFDSALSDLSIDLSILSTECRLSLSGATSIEGPSNLLISIFTILSMSGFLLFLVPIYISNYRNDLTLFLSLSSFTLLGSLIIDMMLLMINITLFARVMTEQFRPFMLISLAGLVSIALKMRILFVSMETRLRGQIRDLNAWRKSLLFSMLGCIAVSMVSIFSASFLVVNYPLFLGLFCYLAIQVWHNFFHVAQLNCFSFSAHVPIFLPQVLLPIMLRSLPSRLTLLRQDFGFCAGLSALVVFFLLVFAGQRVLGPKFFVPKSLVPGYHEYYQLVNSHPGELGTCPICFGDLRREGVAAKEKYMLTPCGHRFHSECLLTWMGRSKVCPCCRTGLPQN